MNNQKTTVKQHKTKKQEMNLKWQTIENNNKEHETNRNRQCTNEIITYEQMSTSMEHNIEDEHMNACRTWKQWNVQYTKYMNMNTTHDHTKNKNKREKQNGKGDNRKNEKLKNGKNR